MTNIQKTAMLMDGILAQGSTSASKTGSNDSFKNVFATATGAEQNMQKDKMSAFENTGGKDTSVQDNGEVLKYKLGSTAKSGVSSAAEELPEEEILAVLQTLFSDIRDLIMNNLQVTEEDLNAVMQEMGITDIDLLNPQVISELAMELTEVEDVTELLLQPELSQSFKQLQEGITELKQEVFRSVDMTEPEVIDLFQKEFSGELSHPLEEMPEKRTQSDNMPQLNPETEAQEHIQTPKAGDTQPQSGEQQGAPDQKGSTVPEKAVEIKTSSEKSTGEHNSLNANILDGLKQAVEQAVPKADGEKVIRQIVEQIKVSVRADTTSFEMQLNPEHLGKINLQVAAKDGVVTASIMTENQAVRDIIEGQLVQLKESLNNQGIKVEAVEVTIASHEFEQNLDQHGQEQQKEGQAEGKRRFRADLMDASEDELTPAEAIIREMMIADGNKINYSA